MMWSFARDRGFPLWKYIEKVCRLSFMRPEHRADILITQVNTRLAMPTVAIGITIVITLLLNLISVGSPVAFNEVISLTVSALYASYLSACLLLLWRRCEGSIKPHDAAVDSADGPANLPGQEGRLTWGPWRVSEPFGTIINAFACIYLSIVFIFSFFPPATPVTPVTMNWSILVSGAAAILSALYYVLYGRKTYKGPRIEISTQK